MTSKLQVVSFVLLAVGISGCDSPSNSTTPPAATEQAAPVTPKPAESNTGDNQATSMPMPAAPATGEATGTAPAPTSTTSPEVTTSTGVTAAPATVPPVQEDLVDQADVPPESNKDAKGGPQD